VKCLCLLGLLDWDSFPRQSGHPFSLGSIPLPLSAFAAAYLVELDQHRTYMSQLRQYLLEHPTLVWALGFPLIPSCQFP